MIISCNQRSVNSCANQPPSCTNRSRSKNRSRKRCSISSTDFLDPLLSFVSVVERYLKDYIPLLTIILGYCQLYISHPRSTCNGTFDLIYLGDRARPGDGVLSSKVPCQMGGAGRGLYNEVQCIMGDGHMGPSRGHTHPHTREWEHYLPATSSAGDKSCLNRSDR